MGTILFVLLIGLVLTTILWARQGAQSPHAANLGTMSHHWLADHNASRHTSSM